jgi:CRISPR/Cas system-associated protein Csx1
LETIKDQGPHYACKNEIAQNYIRAVAGANDMKETEKQEKILEAFRLNFSGRSVVPDKNWRSELMQQINNLDMNTDPEEISLRRSEERILRIGWISLAASTAALILFGIFYFHVEKKRQEQDTAKYLYDCITIENKLYRCR